MHVFVDGSELTPNAMNQPHVRQYLHAWGIVINHNDESHEFHGAAMHYMGLKGYHEYIAFVEAILKVKEMGEDPAAAVWHTDCDALPFFGFFHHEQNYRKTALEARAAKLKFLCNKCYDDSVLELVIHVLATARFVRIKGHKRDVYHSRCDYLARYANRIKRNIEIAFCHFDEWIMKGFCEYDKQGNAYQWFPPFTNSI